MGFFSKLFKGPEIDQEKSAANAARMRELFDAVVPEGGKYRLIFPLDRMEFYLRTYTAKPPELRRTGEKIAEMLSTANVKYEVTENDNSVSE